MRLAASSLHYITGGNTNIVSGITEQLFAQIKKKNFYVSKHIRLVINNIICHVKFIFIWYSYSYDGNK